MPPAPASSPRLGRFFFEENPAAINEPPAPGFLAGAPAHRGVPVPAVNAAVGNEPTEPPAHHGPISSSPRLQASSDAMPKPPATNRRRSTISLPLPWKDNPANSEPLQVPQPKRQQPFISPQRSPAPRKLVRENRTNTANHGKSDGTGHPLFSLTIRDKISKARDTLDLIFGDNTGRVAYRDSERMLPPPPVPLDVGTIPAAWLAKKLRSKAESDDPAPEKGTTQSLGAKHRSPSVSSLDGVADAEAKPNDEGHRRAKDDLDMKDGYSRIPGTRRGGGDHARDGGRAHEDCCGPRSRNAHPVDKYLSGGMVENHQLGDTRHVRRISRSEIGNKTLTLREVYKAQEHPDTPGKQVPEVGGHDTQSKLPQTMLDKALPPLPTKPPSPVSAPSARCPTPVTPPIPVHAPACGTNIEEPSLVSRTSRDQPRNEQPVIEWYPTPQKDEGKRYLSFPRLPSGITKKLKRGFISFSKHHKTTRQQQKPTGEVPRPAGGVSLA